MDHVRRKGFGDERGLRRHLFTRRLHIPARNNDLDVRPSLRDMPSEREAIHCPRHLDIRKQHDHRRRMLLENSERVVARLGIHASKPGVFQNSARIQSDDRVVIDGEGVGGG